MFIIAGAIAHSSLNQKAPVAYTSTATKELDDLMASLSDFKVRENFVYSDKTIYPLSNDGLWSKKKIEVMKLLSFLRTKNLSPTYAS